MAATAGVVLASGTAYAFYATSVAPATLSSAASTATVQPVTIVAGTVVGTKLQPGGTGDLVIKVTNPNSYAVQVTALVLGSVTGCGTPDVTLTSPSTSYLPVTVAANANATSITVPGALSMGQNASNDCQNASLTLALTPTVRV